MTAAEREMAEALKQYMIYCFTYCVEPAVLFEERELELVQRLRAERGQVAWREPR